MGFNNALSGSPQEVFTYDELSRLREVHSGTLDGPLLEASSYDLIGNISSKLGQGNYAYDPLHPHAVAHTDNGAYGYDEVGNQVTRPEQTLRYTAKNKLRSLDGTNGSTAYEYDAQGTRVMKRTADGLTVYAGGLFESHWSATAGWENRYYIAAGARVVAELVRSGSGEKTYYVHDDHLGSVSTVTDASGTVVGEKKYDAFGKLVSSTSGLQSVNRGFTGHEDEPDIGLVNMRGRMYDPQLGRFTSADPFVQAPALSESLNRYSYVWNNPLSLVDPSGYETSVQRTYYYGEAGAAIAVVAGTVACLFSDCLGGDDGGGSGSGGSTSQSKPAPPPQPKYATPDAPKYTDTVPVSGGSEQWMGSTGPGGASPGGAGTGAGRAAPSGGHGPLAHLVGLINLLKDLPPEDVPANGYDTADQAGFAALKVVHALSIKTGWEWGGLLYQTPAGRFFYSPPGTNQLHGDVDVRMGGIPIGAREAGSYFSHVEVYTPGPTWVVSDDWYWDSYLGNSTYQVIGNGRIFVHVPGVGEIEAPPFLGQ